MRNLAPSFALAGLMIVGMIPSFAASAAEEGAVPPKEEPPAAAPASPNPLTANVGLFSQYIFRGITYTREKPAIQGGFDYVDPSGWYVGFWGSNVSNVAINNASAETDPYGGYTGSIGDFTYDIGLLQFYYAGGKYNVSGESYNTLELYAGLTYKFVNIKYSHELTDYFGFNDRSVAQDFGLTPNGDSKGSHYLEANLNFDLGQGFSLGLHAGRQTVKHYEQFNFTDYKIGISKDLGSGYLASMAYIDTNANKTLYTDVHGLDTGRAKWLVSIKRTF